MPTLHSDFCKLFRATWTLNLEIDVAVEVFFKCHFFNAVGNKNKHIWWQKSQRQIKTYTKMFLCNIPLQPQ